MSEIVGQPLDNSTVPFPTHHDLPAIQHDELAPELPHELLVEKQPEISVHEATEDLSAVNQKYADIREQRQKAIEEILAQVEKEKEEHLHARELQSVHEDAVPTVDVPDVSHPLSIDSSRLDTDLSGVTESTAETIATPVDAVVKTSDENETPLAVSEVATTLGEKTDVSVDSLSTYYKELMEKSKMRVADIAPVIQTELPIEERPSESVDSFVGAPQNDEVAEVIAHHDTKEELETPQDVVPIDTTEEIVPVSPPIEIPVAPIDTKEEPVPPQKDDEVEKQEMFLTPGLELPKVPEVGVKPISILPTLAVSSKNEHVDAKNNGLSSFFGRMFHNEHKPDISTASSLFPTRIDKPQSIPTIREVPINTVASSSIPQEVTVPVGEMPTPTEPVIAEHTEASAPVSEPIAVVSAGELGFVRIAKEDHTNLPVSPKAIARRRGHDHMTIRRIMSK